MNKFIVGAISLLCCFNFTLLFRSMIYAMPEMSAKLHWGNSQQEQVLMIAGIGDVVGVVLAVKLYDWIKLTPMVVMTSLGSGILTLFLPILAQKAGYEAIMLVRFFIGFYCGLLVPLPVIVPREWTDKKDRDFTNSAINSGFFFGYIFFAFTGLIKNWRHIFYISGGTSIFTAVLASVFFSDTPGSNNFFRGQEEEDVDAQDAHGVDPGGLGIVRRKKVWLQRDLFDVTPDLPPSSTSFLRMLSSAPVIACLSGFFSCSWQYEAALNYNQYFLEEIHGLSPSTVNILNTIPHTTVTIFIMIVGSYIARMRKEDSKLTTRRIGGVFLLLSGLYFPLLAATEKVKGLDDPYRMIIIVLVVMFSGLRATVYFSVYSSITDVVPPELTASLMAVCNVIAAIPTFGPTALKHLIKAEKMSNWWLILLISNGIVSLFAFGYVVLIGVDTQDLNGKGKKDKKLEHKLQQPPQSNQDETANVEEMKVQDHVIYRWHQNENNASDYEVIVKLLEVVENMENNDD